ncbi:RNA-directed DNA polymerase, partial [Klebsiella pneumoniae]|uniref:RNA-directed DNA polymerase n=1 Tax=Klebsiella pneumoniae TaxID=573 RepID=UPI0035324733
MLHRVITLAWETSSIPADWELSVIVPIFKKGDNRECSNHRGISLLSVPGKIYSRILERRLRSQVETKLLESQCGFRPNRGTQDAIFIVRQIAERTIEYGKDAHMCFIDIEKAFDWVPWQSIWKALDSFQVPKELATRIKSFYKICRNEVRTGHSTSSQFLTNSGVRQGDILSPLLFTLVMDSALKNCAGFKNFQVGNWKMRQVVVNSLAYADDVMLVADSAEKLQHNLNLLSRALDAVGLKLSLTKSKTMVISRQPKRHQVLLNEHALEQVQSFTYLGVWISENGKLRDEFNARIASASRMMGAINSKFLNKKEVGVPTKLAVYRTTYVPI